MTKFMYIEEEGEGAGNIYSQFHREVMGSPNWSLDTATHTLWAGI
jgi:hypothetical protein